MIFGTTLTYLLNLNLECTILPTEFFEEIKSYRTDKESKEPCFGSNGGATCIASQPNSALMHLLLVAKRRNIYASRNAGHE